MENGESLAGWRVSCASESAITVYCPMWITIKTCQRKENTWKRLPCFIICAKIIREREGEREGERERERGKNKQTNTESRPQLRPAPEDDQSESAEITASNLRWIVMMK